MSSKRVDDSGRITEPGEYVLTSDRRIEGVVPPSEAMIRIESGDVTLDGGGHAIVGNGVTDTTAVTTAGGRLANVVVRNVSLTGWEVGLHLRGVERATVRGVQAERNSYGLLFDEVTGASVDGCTVRENLVGVALDPSTEFDAEGNEIADNRLEDVLRETDAD